MKGLIICLLVIVAVTAVRSQGPPTKTKKGTRPARRIDNPDKGLPSGADVPDGRLNSAPPRAAPKPAARPAPKQATRPASRPAARTAPNSAVRPAANPAAKPAANAARRPLLSKTRSGPPSPAAPAARPATRLTPMPTASPAAYPARRTDNPDIGIPSGADVPDGRQFVGAPPKAAPKPAARTAIIPAARTASMPSASPAVNFVRRPMATKTKSGPPPPGRRNDNPDVGLPSGRDYPDAGTGRPLAPVQPAPYKPPAVPAVPAAAPAFECAFFCPLYYMPVCSKSGKQYDHDCYRKCSGDVYGCEGPCPCYGEPETPTPDPMYPTWNDCTYNCPLDNNPVCVEGEEFRNECYAVCSGHEPTSFTCSSSCPC